MAAALPITMKDSPTHHPPRRLRLMCCSMVLGRSLWTPPTAGTVSVLVSRGQWGARHWAPLLQLPHNTTQHGQMFSCSFEAPSLHMMCVPSWEGPPAPCPSSPERGAPWARATLVCCHTQHPPGIPGQQQLPAPGPALGASIHLGGRGGELALGVRLDHEGPPRPPCQLPLTVPPQALLSPLQGPHALG